MIIKIAGENVIGLKDNDEVTVREIYDKVKKYYEVEDARMRLAQEECDVLFRDENDNDISEEAAEVVYEEVADLAINIMEKSDSYWDSYWAAFDEAINEVTRRKRQMSMF